MRRERGKQLEPIILLDVDGVLNPTLSARSGQPTASLSSEKRALVRRLSRSGNIAWLTTCPAEILTLLEPQLNLDPAPGRVTIVFRRADEYEPTPKLHSVIRWLARMTAAGEADWDSVVWIDDVLGPDARHWARAHHQPVLLEQPDARHGLLEEHVVRVEAFKQSAPGACNPLDLSAPPG